MKDRALVTREKAEYEAGELRAIMESLAGLPDGTVCRVVAVVTTHNDDGTHGLKVVTDGDEPAESVAGLLTHAARHVHGGCLACARQNRRNGRHAAGPG